MKDRKDDIFILDFFEVTFLLTAAFIAAALLVRKLNPKNNSKPTHAFLKGLNGKDDEL